MALPFDKATVKVVKLYRDCLRLAKYQGGKTGHTESIMNEVRKVFRSNMKETDPDKIMAQKEAAIRALSNYMFVAASEMAKDTPEPKNIFDPE